MAVADCDHKTGNIEANVPQKAGDTTASDRLVEYYNTLFQILPADTPERLEECYRLRYQVYCLETGFEDKDAFQDGMERDHFDTHSVSSLLIHKPSGLVAGTVRVILPDPDGATNGHTIPARIVSPDVRILEDEVLPKATTAEISRFSISKQFRMRQGDTHIPAYTDVASQLDERRIIPHITLGLMTAALRVGVEHNMTHLAVLMEPTLERLLRRMGIHLNPVGPILNYHGKRRAFFSDVDSLLSRMYEEQQDVWEVVTECGKLWDGVGHHMQESALAHALPQTR